MSKRDYYEILGVSKNADQSEIKKSYRKLAMTHHPDRNPGNKDAEKKFKELNDAYDILKDDNKRAAYDRNGHAAFSQEAGGGGHHNQNFGEEFQDFSDVFSSIFGSSFGGSQKKQRQAATRGVDLRYNLTITLIDAYYGKKHTIQYKTAATCDTCSGSGSQNNAKKINCLACGGTGSMRAKQGFFTVETTCRTCNGLGSVIKDPCKTCYGNGRLQKEKNIVVSIPAGIEEGTKIRLGGGGEAGMQGGMAGDLYIFISIQNHPIFTRKGNDLYCELPIKLTTAALGGKTEVLCIDKSISLLSVPSGLQSGSQFRLSKKGMPSGSNSFGDLYVKACIETPVNLTAKQRSLLEEFEKESEGNSSPAVNGFLKKVKSFLTGS